MSINKPFKIINPQLFYKGTVYKSLSGDYFTIIDYIDSRNVKIKFLDEYGYETNALLFNILKGSVKNPYHKLEYGGYYGVGPYKAIDNMHIYKVWEGIMKRSSGFENKSHLYAYSKVSVCDEWRNFQVFCKWYLDYISTLNPKYYKEYQIDKDIFQWNFEYKIYSPHTCCIIPRRLNSILVGLNLNRKNNELPTGVTYNGNKLSVYINFNGIKKYFGTFDNYSDAFNVYRKEKLSLIKELSYNYYNDNAITKDVYDKLCTIELLP